MNTTSRDELIIELIAKGLWCSELAWVADFIIEDRKRVVAPLVKLTWDGIKLMDTISNVDNAINETLKKAGVQP